MYCCIDFIMYIIIFRHKDSYIWLTLQQYLPYCASFFHGLTLHKHELMIIEVDNYRQYFRFDTPIQIFEGSGKNVQLICIMACPNSLYIREKVERILNSLYTDENKGSLHLSSCRNFKKLNALMRYLHEQLKTEFDSW